MSATMWFVVFVQCIVWILMFLYWNHLYKEINKKTRQVMLELLQGLQDKQPAQRPFIEQHARNTQAIAKRAMSTGQWPEEERQKSQY